MAHIFKHPENGNKGIIVFTHKEFGLFSGGRKIQKRDIYRPLFLFKKILSNFLLRKAFSRFIVDITDKYFIGVHWGFHAENVFSPVWVDFHMAAKGTCTFTGDPLVVNLNSASFTPSVMENRNHEKYWDIICVAKNDKKKKYPELMSSIRKLFDAGYKYKILFIIASNKNEKNTAYYTDIIKDYTKLFTAQEREIFTIIKTHPETGFQGFSYTVLSHFYNQSKVFTLFSQREGGSKVIKEAQLCGLPVVVKSDLLGGGRDYLNEKNAAFFDEYDRAHEALIYAVENYKDFIIDTESLKREIEEQYSLEELKIFFSKLFLNNGQFFNGELINIDNLNRRLPAHYFDETVSWASDSKFRFSTTDIVNSEMLSSFYSKLYKGDEREF